MSADAQSIPTFEQLEPRVLLSGDPTGLSAINPIPYDPYFQPQAVIEMALVPGGQSVLSHIEEMAEDGEQRTESEQEDKKRGSEDEDLRTEDSGSTKQSDSQLPHPSLFTLQRVFPCPK